jgi:hypothetical protein
LFQEPSEAKRENHTQRKDVFPKTTTHSLDEFRGRMVSLYYRSVDCRKGRCRWLIAFRSEAIAESKSIVFPPFPFSL